jgi:hypothetical protein
MPITASVANVAVDDGAALSLAAALDPADVAEPPAVDPQAPSTMTLTMAEIPIAVRRTREEFMTPWCHAANTWLIISMH